MSDNQKSSKEVTIYDIAEALEVAPSTVSRSLQNHSSISEATIKKVREQAKKMGYRSNIFARNLRRQQTNTIGVIIPKLNSYFMSSALAGMEEVANKNGYNLIISQSFETVKKEASNVETMFKSRVDGLIVSLAYDTKDLTHFDRFSQKNIPIIFFDRTADYHSSTNIVINNFKAGRQAAAHLLDQGCKRIIHITGNQIRSVYKERLKGYKKALGDRNIPFNPDYVIENRLNDEDGGKAAHQILEMNPRPDAVFVANDVCAVSCMITLKEYGVSVPEDIAIVGFNNDPISRYVEPKLTTINYHGEEMGKAVARNLINHLQGDEHIGMTNTIILNSDLIVRQSSKRTNS
jgi:LacI family transcriptional regulator